MVWRVSSAKLTAYDEPRIYNVDRDLLEPQNLLAVRVSDWGGWGGIWRHPVALGPVAEVADAIEWAKSE